MVRKVSVMTAIASFSFPHFAYRRLSRDVIEKQFERNIAQLLDHPAEVLHRPGFQAGDELAGVAGVKSRRAFAASSVSPDTWAIPFIIAAKSSGFSARISGPSWG